MTEVVKKSLESTIFYIALTSVCLSVTAAIAYYYVIDRQLMAGNMETAISKGIDPLAVRCSYAPGTDTICVAYAASHGTHSFSSPTPPKK